MNTFAQILEQARKAGPARLVVAQATDGTIGEVYIPALYAGSSEHTSDQVRLGRMTDWKRLSDDLSVAVGLRLFLVDGEDKPLYEARSVQFEPVKH